MAVKPTEVPRWADVSGDIVEPTEPKKDEGWLDGELPPHSYFNWLFNLIYAWTLWLQNFENEVHTWSARQAFEARITSVANSALPVVDAQNTSSNGPAIRGIVNDGDGVIGQAQAGKAVKATVFGAGIAVEANATAAASTGVKASATAATARALDVANTTTSSALPTEAARIQGAHVTATGHRPGDALVVQGGNVTGSGDWITGGVGATITGGEGDQNGGVGAVIVGGVGANNGGTGLQVTGGAGINANSGVAIAAQVGSGGTDAIRTVGDINMQFSGKLKFTVNTNLASNVGQTNQLSSGLVPKAWASITWTNGAPTLLDGQNIASISSPAAGQIDLTLAASISGGSGIFCAVPGCSFNHDARTNVPGGTGGPTRFFVFDHNTTTPTVFGSSSGRLTIIIFGLQ